MDTTHTRLTDLGLLLGAVLINVPFALLGARFDYPAVLRADAGILRMIRRVVAAGHGEGRKVGVCGEMASDRALAVLLVALGVDELSVVPSAIPEIKQALAEVEVRALSKGLDDLLALSEAEAIRAELRKYLGDGS